MSSGTKPTTVEQYHFAQPESVQKALDSMRSTIRKAAPQAEEIISYGMPAYRQNGMLVYYAAWKEHIGLYAISATIRKVFEGDLAPYEQSKGTIRFPLGKPLPVTLITKIVQFRLKENAEKAAVKSGKKPAKKAPEKKPSPSKKTTAKPAMPELPAPAQRALTAAGLTTLKKLAQHTKEELLALHGVGPSSIPKIEAALKKAGLKLKKS